MKIGSLANIINTYNNYQRKIKADYNELEYYKAIGSKLGIEQAKKQLEKDKAEFGEFLDYEI